MSNANNYPSCIKIPTTSTKHNMTSAMFSQKFDVKEALEFNNELISLANRIFGGRKWSHAVTNQTLDFVESLMGKYICGCSTFVKIQLPDGTFHEDMGYCVAEGATKGLSIHCARAGSLTDAFKKVLLCFGDTIEMEITKLTKKLQHTAVPQIQKQDSQSSISSIQTDAEPCAQSTPFITRKGSEQKEKIEIISKPKSPNDPKEKTAVQETTSKVKSSNDQKGQGGILSSIFRAKSPTEQRGQSIQQSNSPKPKSRSPSNLNVAQFNTANHLTEQDNIQKDQDQKRVLTEEELLRMERKRKQMEKQAEYKRLMKEKEQQKSNDYKNPNHKY